MTTSDSNQNTSAQVDPDILAVRSLMEQKDSGEVPSQVSRSIKTLGQADQAQPHKSWSGNQPKSSKVRRLPPLSSVEADKPTITKRAACMSQRLSTMLFQAVINYRPESKLILRTSLILMLLLQPFFILGSMLITLLVTLACYVWAGPEHFWRKVLETYRKFAIYKPDAARVLKLRAYVLYRRWDAILDDLPIWVSDALRVPDLRELVRADEQHLQAMNNRLNRLV